MAGSRLKSGRSSSNLGNFWPSLSFCRAGRVAQVFEDETCHSTRQSRFLRVETSHRLSEVLDPTVTGRFQLGWSVLLGLKFAWTLLLLVVSFHYILTFFYII